MRRMKAILAVSALLVALLVATAAPAMAMGNGVNEERGESPRVQANEERGFNHNFFFNPAFNNVGFNTLGFSPLVIFPTSNTCGWNWTWNWNWGCNNGLIF